MFFINNAHQPFEQTRLLMDVFERDGNTQIKKCQYCKQEQVSKYIKRLSVLFVESIFKSFIKRFKNDKRQKM